MVGTTNKSIAAKARRVIAHKGAPDSTRSRLLSRGSVAGRPHVVIVGAGFGGLSAAKGLAKAAVEIQSHRSQEPPPVSAAALPSSFNPGVQSDRISVDAMWLTRLLIFQ